MKVLMPVFKIAAVWLTLLIGQVLGGLVSEILFHPPAMTMLNDGGLDLTQALAIVTGVFAVILSALAARMRGPFLTRTIYLLVFFYCLQTVLSLIEAVYFNAYLKLATSTLWMIAVGNLIQAVLATVVATALFHGSDETPERFTGHLWKAVLISLLYVVVYFGAGAMIAWQGAAVRAYYQQGMHIDMPQLTLLQVGRGLIWAGLAYIGARQLSGPRLSRALLTGVAFSGFMAIQLLIPSSFMPWPVRVMHLMEVGSSNFLFGFLAAWIWMIGMKPKAS